jgi:hypothetical protein
MDKSAKLKLVGVIASLTALAIILSPVSSFTRPELNSNGDVAAGNNLLGDVVIDEDKIAPKEISDQDFDDCNAVGDKLDSLLVGVSSNDGEAGSGSQSSFEMKRKIASDLLAGEFCNRPQLVSEIIPMHAPDIALVAYACDSALEKVGDIALQLSLADYKEIYCSSAKIAITEKSDSLLESVESYRSDDEDSSPASNSTTTDDENVSLKLDEIVSLANDAKGLVDSEMYYDAAKAFDKASKLFDELFEPEQQR